MPAGCLVVTRDEQLTMRLGAGVAMRWLVDQRLLQLLVLHLPCFRAGMLERDNSTMQFQKTWVLDVGAQIFYHGWRTFGLQNSSTIC